MVGTMTAPAVLMIDEDLDWSETLVDCAKVVVRFSVPLKAAAVKVCVAALQSLQKCLGTQSEMFIKLAAFLVPFALEFFLQRLADYADVEVPEAAPEAMGRQEERRHAPTASQTHLWEAEQQRQRWDDMDRKEVNEEKTVPSWSLDDGQDDVLDTSDEDVAAGRHPF